MMHVFLFGIYFLILSFIIVRARFFNSCLKPAYLIILFSIHVAAGCIHNWIAFHYYPNHGDIWLLFEEGVKLKKSFGSNPANFFSFFDRGEFNITDTDKPIFDFQYQFFQRTNSVLDIISFDNLYINTLLFSFPVFAGSVALFKVFLVTSEKPLVAFSSLVMPSILFWTSVVYKDSLFYAAAGLFLYWLFFSSRPVWKRTICLGACIVLMLLSRANAFITLLPALLFFFLTEKKLQTKKIALAITFLTVIVIALIVNSSLPEGLLEAVCERQKSFVSLVGNSRLYLPTLQPSLASMFDVFPAALANGLFQPLPGAGGKGIYTIFSAELLIYWALIVFAICLMFRKPAMRLSNFDLACLLFAVPGIIIIGFMVPFAGAIIRYRSIYLPFLIAPFLRVVCSYPLSVVEYLNSWIAANVLQPGKRNKQVNLIQ